jgi:hypothetical protein
VVGTPAAVLVNLLILLICGQSEIGGRKVWRLPERTIRPATCSRR